MSSSNSAKQKQSKERRHKPIKKCPVCEKVFIAHRFKQNTCSNDCSKKNYVVKNPEKRKESLHKWNTSEKGRASHRKWEENNPEKSREAKQNYYFKYYEITSQRAKEYARQNKDWKNARTAHRRAKKIQATPKWANKKEIDYIYSLAHEKGLVVDHIVPLNSDSVCGLHTGDNLRCIPKELNERKSNRYWPDMP